MPLITRENAAEMQRRAQVAIAARKERARLDREKLANLPASADELARSKRVFAQIDRCDQFLEECLDAETYVKLTAAKERLWKLVVPTAGVMRPQPQPKRPRAPLPEPIGAD